MHSIGERLYQTTVSIERHGGNLVCPIAQTVALQQCPNGKRTHVLCSVEQGETLFRGQLDGFPAHHLQHLRTGHDLALVFDITHTHQWQREMGKGYKVARGSQ